MGAYRRILTAGRTPADPSGDPFRPLEPECQVVQFNRPLTAAELEKAAAIMRDRPDVELYVYEPASTNLDFLRCFPDLRRLHLSLYALDDIGGFAHLNGALEELTFSATRKTFSLRFLEGFPRLSKLFLQRHRKDLAAVRHLGQLTSLGLSGITLPDLSLLLPLAELRHLSIFLGGTTNLEMLRQLPALESLFLMRIARMSDLGVLAGLERLRSLRLDWMRNVRSLPSLSRLSSLDSVELDTMKGLTDLSPLAAAPALRRLVVRAMPQLDAESFRCFIGHPRLAELWGYTGKKRVNDAIKRMFPGVAR